jgi:hypothetical protein
MKKLFLFSFLLLVVLSYSQKKVSIYNYSSFAMKIYNVKTKPTAGTYPFYLGYNVGLFPNEAALLVNTASTTKFPFYSPVITPTVYGPGSFDWKRCTALNVFDPYVTGQSIWNTFVGNTQVLAGIYYSVGTITGAGQSAGYFAIPNSAPYSSVFLSATWRIDYERIYTTPTNYEDIIIFSDL